MNARAVGPGDVVVRVEDMRTAPVDGGLVILNLLASNYVGLDEIGRRIWERLEQPAVVRDLCSGLAADYSGDPEQIAADLLHFLNELCDQKLLIVT